MIGNGFDSLAPQRAQLLAYRAAEWGGFGFGVVGTKFFLTYFFSITLSYLRITSDDPLFLPPGCRSRWKARRRGSRYPTQLYHNSKEQGLRGREDGWPFLHPPNDLITLLFILHYGHTFIRHKLYIPPYSINNTLKPTESTPLWTAPGHSPVCTPLIGRTTFLAHWVPDRLPYPQTFSPDGAHLNERPTFPPKTTGRSVLTEPRSYEGPNLVGVHQAVPR